MLPVDDIMPIIIKLGSIEFIYSQVYMLSLTIWF